MSTPTLTNFFDERWPDVTVASTRELAARGVDHRVLTEAVKRRELVRLRRGVYVRRTTWLSLKPLEQDRLRIEAHWLSTGGSAVYSHTSGARAHGLSTWDVGPKVHVTVPYSGSKTSHGVDVVAHSLPVPEVDLARVAIAPGRIATAVGVERTVADCARTLDIERAAIIGDSALRRGVTIERIRAAAERTRVVRGSRKVEDLLAVLDGRSESAGETRTRLALAAAGLPAPHLQYEIPTIHGLFRADFAWPDLLVILEFDGDSKYFDYRPTAEALLLERRREVALMEEGWTVVRTR
ncbi:type IV toxin-antitoxin system AbiEi family antitoxin domain-containing protein [Sinomonas sp. ASV486]|uniref:type IV toxin-antitoxin system AbiEi family antitoxin domain-containing protein n=1 Tax=Sinomonas sp. ASV486 TaxID=3051170 RepID=UPI0027DDC899|nr:type IV toxin-antitoxin system AbiEi family antitoxin domain-containing protein [Sinomonas sp. ASV486]MDQ4488646.1 type IV toxin-antitoxin system AbiEi family antitoxin domain-containing protein [Sinomonas sp. ASV486]